MNALLQLHFFRALPNKEKKRLWEERGEELATALHEGRWPGKEMPPKDWEVRWEEASKAAQRELAHAQTEGYSIWTFDDPAYPEYLREVADPPMALFGRGNWPQTKKPLAVVGTRKLTNYGVASIRELVLVLGAYPVHLVSGLALGVDAEVHRQAVDMGVATSAFLAGGMKDISPPRHRMLAAELLETGGGYFTEQAFEQDPTRAHFPVRNRLIAASSLATVVVESARKSGALITANMAFAYNRPVFAVPGARFQPYSVGPNLLIEQHIAEALVDFDAFPERFYPLWQANSSKLDLSGSVEERILGQLPHGRRVHAYDLTRLLGVGNVLIYKGLRVLMELDLVVRIGPDTYARKSA